MEKTGQSPPNLQTPIDRIWGFFASIKLAIIVFALIALTSIVGTVLEQQAEPEKNIKVLGKIFGESLAPSLYGFFDSLGFLNMYRSWWFVTLLGLFAANLIICSIDRFPAIWKVVRAPIKPMGDEHWRGLPIKEEFSVKGSAEGIRERAAAALRAAGFKPSESKEEGSVQLYAEKGRHTRLGVYVTHLSIIVIMVGALAGVFFGFKGGINLPEGAAYPVAFERKGLTEEQRREQEVILTTLEATSGGVSAAAGQLHVPEDHLRRRMRVLGMYPFDFTVRCDDFEVAFYGRSDMPKEYTSHLTVTDGGREVIKKWITVNDPLRYKGVTFYQSSYGVMPDTSGVQFIIRATSPSGQSETLRVKQGEKFNIPGSTMEAVPVSFSPALSYDESGRPFTYAEMMNNPAVQLEIIDASGTQTKWVLKRYPESGSMPSGGRIELLDVWGAQYTGLQVRRDPGVWIVYLGCLLMSLGLYVAFFTGHRRVWVRLRGAKGSVAVTVGASSNKGKLAFERKINKLTSLLREGGNK